MARTSSSNKTNQNKNAAELPLLPGEYANWAGVNHSELQTIIDFGFIQPVRKGEKKTGVIIQRVILPPAIAENLGEILTKHFKNGKNGYKKTRKKN